MSIELDGVMRPKSKAFGWRHLLLGLWLVACGGALGTRQAGGESHFLWRCETSCDSGLECISGVCTRGCVVGSDSCADLSAQASCTADSIEPGAVAVCDVSCEDDASCAALGSGFECAGGFCRGPSLPGQGVAGSSGSGAAGSSSAPTTCSVDTNEPCGADEVCVEGECRAVYRTPGCSFPYTGGLPCPDGFVCRPEPGIDPLADVPGLCIQESRQRCTAGGNECGDGFECVLYADEGDCMPTLVNCWAPWQCDIVDPPACPYGYGRSRTGVDGDVANCAGPCVPLTRCGCSDDAECPEGSVCDRVAGSCVAERPWQPPPQCELPFETGPCRADMGVYAAVDGVCVLRTYGGCDGNANRFSTLEECMAVCEGRPHASACPAGLVERDVCVQCGVVGGCGLSLTACARPCTDHAECESEIPLFGCGDGVCQVNGCY